MKTIFWKVSRKKGIICFTVCCSLLLCALTACGTQTQQEILQQETNVSFDVAITSLEEKNSEKTSDTETIEKENLSTQNREEIQDNSDMEIEANIVRARTFDTFQELEENEKKQENGLTAYYVPAVLGEKCSLIGISKQEGVYLATSYQVFTETIHPEAATAYERELVGSILCTQYLFSEPDGTIEMFRRNNYQEMQYGDRVIYVKESRSQRDDSVLLGYEVVFAIDQTAFHIHLPAVNSFEEMMQFTELVKHVIE